MQMVFTPSEPAAQEVYNSLVCAFIKESSISLLGSRMNAPFGDVLPALITVAEKANARDWKSLSGP